MLTKNILNITFFITLVLFASVYAHAHSRSKKTHEESRWNSLMSHAKNKNTPKPSLLQMTQDGVLFPTLDDALAVDVKQYQGSCSDLFKVREALDSFLDKFANYTPQVLDNDLSKLQAAKSLVSQVLQHMSDDVPSLVQMGSKAQLQESLAVMDRLKSLSLVKEVSVDDVRQQVAQYLTASTLQAQRADASSLLDSLSTMITQVSTVKSQVFNVEAVNVLTTKKQAVNSMISTICFTRYNPVVNVTQFDTADQSVSAGRNYRYFDDEPNFYELTGPNITEGLFRDYVVGGWVRWLDFINGTFDNSNEEVMIYRVASTTYDDLEEDAKFADAHVELYATKDSYQFCTHDTNTNEIHVCHTFNISGYNRENSWHFVMFMYSFDTKTAIARVRLGEDDWLSYTFPGSIDQVVFNGTLTFYVGHDAFFGSYAGFNGELEGWDIWYGVNSWLSQESMWLDEAAEGICLKYFTEPTAIPYVEKEFEPNNKRQKQTSADTSVFTFVNTFWEAEDYGFAAWFKLDHTRAFDSERKQLATYAFETRSDIKTAGNAIAEAFIENGLLYVSVTYVQNNRPVTSTKQVAPIYTDDWFLLQVHFSTSDSNIQAFFEQAKEVTTVTWDDVSRVFIPANVFLVLGNSPLVNITGADFSFKGVWLYAGVQQYYGQPCDDACVTCNGPDSDDCTSCADGFYSDDGECLPCDEGCKVCRSCGECSTSECITCEDGLFLADGKCGCDPTCETCDGASADDCLSCKDPHQFVQDGHCETCDDACTECSGPSAQNCTVCPDGYKVSPSPVGECVPICDYDRCKECNEDGSECIACNDPLVLSDGECVPCDSSCLKCSGPADYQCTECQEPLQFHDGKCFVCDETCLTCDGPNDDECVTCDTDKELVDGRCLPPCDTDNGSYRDGSECLPCDKSCVTCSGPNTDDCIICPTNFTNSNGTCVPNEITCDTLNGYVLVNGTCLYCDIEDGYALINQECIPCDETCKTCDGPTDSDCLSCRNPDYFVVNGKCGPIHPECDTTQGWFVDENGDCVPCQTNCTVCPEGYELQEDGSCQETFVPPECDETQGYTIVDGDCVPCDTSCKTCHDAADTCTSCDEENNYYLLNGQCLLCEVEDGWYLSNGECNLCSKDCFTCEGAEDYCTSCYDNYVLTNDGHCNPPCDTDNGYVSINDECLPCDETCKTCSGTSYLDCIECAEGLEYVDERCVEPCDTDNGYVRVDGQCLPCHESCATCDGTSNTDCTSCPENYTLQAGACVVPVNCDVDNGYVWVNEECVSCDPSCKTCDGISNSDCTDCFDGYVLSSGSCNVPEPDCNVTDGKVLINGECYDCDETCKTCDGVAATDCTECAEGLEREGDLCVEPCDVENGFYKKNGACLECDKECLTCDGPDNFNCLSCEEGYFLENGRCIEERCLNEDYNFTEAENGACTSDCDCDGTRRCAPNGICHDCNFVVMTYPDNFTSEHCPPCDESCQTCRGSRPSDCSSCLENEVLLDGYCYPCDDSCKTCSGTGPSDCLTCEEGEVYTNGSCIVPCDTDNGFFYSDPKTCSPCDKDCKTCDGFGENNCTSCYEGFVLVDGECLVPCDTDNGNFYDSNGDCQPCDDSCKTCDGPNPTNCIECDDDYFMEFGECKPAKCVNYEYVFDESIITECNSDCECDGTRRCSPDGQCEDCHYLAENFPNQYTTDLCPPCDETCDTCRGPNTYDCTTCKEHLYFNNGSCLPCDETCNNCTGPSNTECIDCASGLVIVDGLCVVPCDTTDGSYYDKDYNCVPCHETCKTCLDDARDSCESCYGDYILDNGICKPPCDQDKGYTYNDDYECVPCDDSCLTCSGVTSNDCTDCDEGFSLFNGQCISCVSFYFDYDESSNAAGPSHCTSDCECDNSRRCSPEGLCGDCEFLANEYPDLYDIFDCPVCDKDCLTCDGPGANNCTTCYDGDYLGVDNACYPCDDSCLTCDGPSDKECSSCNEGFVLVDGECQVPPPDCDASCKECDGATAQNCTACYDGYELVDKECHEINCIDWTYSFDESTSPLGENRCDDDCECDGTRRCSPSKYCGECLDLVALYPDVYDLNDCPPCDDSCNTCFGPSATECSSCPDGFYLTSSNTCEACDDNCAKCVGTATNCTVCPAGLELNDQNVCVEPCDSSCLTCSGPSANECLTCPERKELVDGVCQDPDCTALNYSHNESANSDGPSRCSSDCDCDSSRRCSSDGYCRECMYLATLYPDLYDQKDCPPCDDSCLTCEGPANTDCTACDDGFALVDGKCSPCDSSCLTCDDVDDSHCLSCPEGKVLNNGRCEDPINCHPTCLECSGPEANNCTKCPDDRILQDDGTCVEPDCISWDWTVTEAEDARCNDDCDCNGARRCSPDGYCQECDDLANGFPTLYNIDDCPPCDKSCATCNGPNEDDCTSCETGYVLVNGYCEPCHETCATCSGVNANDCETCYEGQIIEDGECVDPPPVCDETCLTCSGSAANECLTCNEGFFLAWDHTCQPIEDCVKYDYSFNESTSELGPGRCYDDCDCDNTRRCSPDGYCQECLDLVATYPDQYFESDCPACDKTCLTCNGPSETDCTACADEYVLVDGQCLPCESPCLTCSGSVSECTSCTEPQILENGTCVDPPIECDSSCLECSCTGPECCTACPDNKVLKDGYCVDPDCVAFDYSHDESLNELGPGRCDSDCDCDGSRRCSPDKYCGECFDLVDQYPDIYAHSDCPPCDGSCLSCSGPSATECTTCEDGFVLVDKTCLPCNETCATCHSTAADGCDTCIEGYDLQEDGTCEKHIDCDPSCKTCNGPNVDQCTSCEDGYHLDEGRCVSDCIDFKYIQEEKEDSSCTTDCDCDGTRRCSPSGYCSECSDLASEFPSLFSSDDCPPCDSTCKYCNGPDSDNCIACNDGDYLADDGTCQPCSKDCLTCDGPENNDCTSCYDPQVLNQGYCVDPNPECDESCKTCSGTTASDCTSCYDFYELVDGTCQPINCVEFDYVWDETTNTNGPHTCTSNCECAGSRICGPEGVCGSCYEISDEYSDLFDKKDCPPCDDSCADCSGPSAQECIKCPDGPYVLVDGECKPCDSSCATCWGPESNNCDTCPEGKVLNTDFECVDPPPVCDDSCATCSGTGPNECTSCNLPLVLVDGYCLDPKDCLSFDYVHDEATNVNGSATCSNDCECEGTRMCSPYGYCHECMYLAENFPDEFSSEDCPPCDSSCATCNGPNNNDCLSCDDGFYLSESNTCEPCNENCLTCNGPNNGNCTSCESPLLLDNGFCDIPSPICDETCLECKGPLPTDCISCPENWELTEAGTCEQIDCVAFDYYHDESSNVDGPSVCTSDCDCNGARRCGPSGYCDSCLTLAAAYPSVYSASQCPTCDDSCKDCDGPSASNCTECQDNLYLFNGQCIQCHEDCETCFGPNEDNCLSCKPEQVLYQAKCWTPDPECDPSCVTCSGTAPNECTSCKCDQELIDGYCVDIEVVCDETCETCYGSASNQCSSCPEGRVLLGGECVVVSSFVGVRTEEDTPISYRVPQKYIITSDIGLGSWTKLKSFVQKGDLQHQLLFRLSALSSTDKNDGTNQYRHSTLAVYYNSSHYVFETYTKMSGVASLVQQSLHVGAANMVNKWNLVFFGYSRKNSKASGFVKLTDGNKYEVHFDNIYQDSPEEKMEVFFYGDNLYKGINGEVSSPEVLHGNNFLQTFGGADYKNYFKLQE